MNSKEFRSPDRPQVYDTPAMIFHWLTVLVVIVLFGTAFVWNFILPRDPLWEPTLQSVHVSLGILFSVLILARLIWRLTASRRPPGHAGLAGVLSRSMYAVLYVLLLAQIGLGFAQRWMEGEAISFFGLFSVPALLGVNEGLQYLVGRLHNWGGWAIVILSFGHAGAALVHHYVLKDGTLRRMLPRRLGES